VQSGISLPPFRMSVLLLLALCLISWLTYSLIMKIEAVLFSETSINLEQSTLYHILETS
jgi:hypothetical protein